MTFRWGGGGGFSTAEPFEDLRQIADNTKRERGVLRERVNSVRGAELGMYTDRIGSDFGRIG